MVSLLRPAAQMSIGRPALAAAARCVLPGRVALGIIDGPRVDGRSPVGVRWCYAAPEGKPRGTVLLLQGRTEFLEKYAAVMADLHQRGLAVFTIDWRGQGASARETRYATLGHVWRFEDYLADLDHACSSILATRLHGPLWLIGHSMGGHLGLRALADLPMGRMPGLAALKPRAALFTAPMVDLAIPWIAKASLRPIIHTAVFCGGGTARFRRIAVPQTPDQGFPRNPLTGDAARYRAWMALQIAHPEMTALDLSYGWVAAALMSIEALKVAVAAKRIVQPIALVSGGQDRVVSNRAIKHLAKRLPLCVAQCHLRDARHEPLMETDEHRAAVWTVFDALCYDS